MKLTITQAAKRWKKSKGTLYSRIDSGSLSYTIDDSNPKRKRKLIDVSELIRVFGPEDQQTISKSGAQDTFPADPMNSLMVERLNDTKAAMEYLKKQLEEQKNTYEARIKWLERALEAKETELSESMKEMQGSIQKLLEHQSDTTEVLKENVSIDVQPEPEIVEPERKIEPKKKKGRLWRVLEAALD